MCQLLQSESSAHLKANDGPHVELIALMYVASAFVQLLKAVLRIRLLRGVIGRGLITALRHQQMQAPVLGGCIALVTALLRRLLGSVQAVPSQFQLLPGSTAWALKGWVLVVMQLQVLGRQS